MKDYQKKQIKVLLIKTIVFLGICTIVLSSLFFSKYIEKYLNNLNFKFNNEIANASLRVHFLDVGQGDCTFIELPNGENIMIDTGPVSSIKNVVRYLKVLGVEEKHSIDYLILTHTDSDHIGNAKEVISKYNVKNIFIPKVYSNYEVKNNLDYYDYNIVDTYLWNQTVESIYKNIEINNINYSFKDVVIESEEFNFSLIFYTPLDNNFSDSNDYSPVIILNSNDVKYMFVGDISSKTEKNFLDYYSELVSLNYFDVDVLKISHHGSKNSTTEDFLMAVKPEVAIISCGKSNSYNHPNNDTINRLANVNCKIYRTDITSSIVCVENDRSLYVQTNYQKFLPLYFEWWTVVLTIIIICFYVIFFVKFEFNKKIKKKNKNR